MRDTEFVEQSVQHDLRLSASGSTDLEHRHDVLLDIQAAEDARLLRQVADPQAGAAIHRQAGDVGAVQR